MIVFYKILLVVLKVILFTVQTLGVYFLIHNIPIWRKKRTGASASYEMFLSKDVQKTLNEFLADRKPVYESSSLCGKTIRLDGKDYIVFGENIESINSRNIEKSVTTLMLYRDGKLLSYRLTPEKDKDLYEKYSKRGPVRSRELRKDVRDFCNNACILDCTECILKKYGKGHKVK